MKYHVTRWICLGMVSLLLGCVSTQSVPNTLLRSEQRQGWRLLFDGQSLNGWRGYKKTAAPTKGWVIEDGCLKLEQGSRPGDLVTAEKFDNFELVWDWKISPKGNNGLKYLVSEQRGAPGPEYQMIDDETQTSDKHRTASFYEVLPPASDKPMNPPGQWNRSKLVVRGNQVEHWLNGKKVLAYEFGSPAVEAAIAQSKFKTEPTFGKKAPGHIMLTDHTDEAWYKNIKIREF